MNACVTINHFQEVLRNIHSKHVYIQTHNFPDPDAIASAFALKELLGKFAIDASICYKGKIERYSTTDFVKRLDIQLTSLDELKDMPADAEIILVDSQKGNSNIFDAPGESIICIDHHPIYQKNAGVKYRYRDIRPEMGACATIVAGYFFENHIEMSRSVATALLYGIKTDTMGLSRGVSQADVDVFQKLYRISDLSVMQSLEHCSLTFEDLQAYAHAINSIQIVDNVSFANTGKDCPEALIAKISDFMLDLVEIDFCVVYSFKEDGIKLSVRSMGDLDAGTITNTSLAGIGGGGGHAVMAGGFVPFAENGYSGTCTNEADLAPLTERIKKRFLAAIADGRG